MLVIVSIDKYPVPTKHFKRVHTIKGELCVCEMEGCSLDRNIAVIAVLVESADVWVGNLIDQSAIHPPHWWSFRASRPTE